MNMKVKRFFAKTLLFTTFLSPFIISTGNTAYADLKDKPPTTPFEHYYFGGYRKENVSYYNEYGGWERVSASLYGPGSISSSRSVTQYESVSGSISGIPTISTGQSITSSVGYTLNVPKGKYYMAVRVVYRVETGYRVKDNVVGGRTRNYYKIKVPSHFEYRLLRG